MAAHKKYKSIPNQNYKLGILIPKKPTDSNNSEYTVQDLASTLRKIIPNVGFKKLQKPGFHKNNSYLITLNESPIGHMGQLSYSTQHELNLNNDIFLAEINLEPLKFSSLVSYNYNPLSQYPYIKFDLSFKVPDDLISQKLIDEIELLLNDNENQISIFDDYTNEISRNLGIRIITRSYEKTYNEQETTEVLNNVVSKLTKKFSITLNEKGN
jgi:phenylalanyl-tRNA synthetase beta subunit